MGCGYNSYSCTDNGDDAMSYEVLRAIVWIVGLPIIGYLGWQAVMKLRAIRRLDAELREEEAQNPETLIFAWRSFSRNRSKTRSGKEERRPRWDFG
ncbi:MAG: hypothetical protein QM758_01735 [Armatimonas sp.]